MNDHSQTQSDILLAASRNSSSHLSQTVLLLERFLNMVAWLSLAVVASVTIIIFNKTGSAPGPLIVAVVALVVGLLRLSRRRRHAQSI